MTNFSPIKMIISPREKDLGGFFVRRVLPYAAQRMVGPFIFLDHMGPADFAAGDALNVRPHPHINLATVTYLFEGQFQHRDSLGSNQVIEPGAINWMTAGRGVVHSERTPPNLIESGGRLHGIQIWVALPEDKEEMAPSFTHHPKKTLPEFKLENIQFKILLGELFAHKSPVQIHSDMYYAECFIPKGAILNLPLKKAHENAAYVVKGQVSIDRQSVSAFSMAVFNEIETVQITALEDTHLMLLGGEKMNPRYMYWNFISSSKERIEEAKLAWKNGPHASSARFHPIPDDQDEFISLPLD